VQQLSDTALMRRVQDDDARAFAALYERHAARALGLAASVVRSPERAEDAVQEAFVSAWRSRGEYREERGDVRAWLLTIVRNRSLDALRRTAARERPWEPLDLHDAADERIEPADDRAARRDAARALREAIAGLPPDQGVALELSYFSGLSQSEIATLLGVPLGTVKSRIRLGLRRLSATMVPALSAA